MGHESAVQVAFKAMVFNSNLGIAVTIRNRNR